MRYTTLVVFLLSACAAPQPQYRWDRPGATREQLINESAQCEQAGASITSNDQNRIMQVMLSCMYSKGWRLVDR